MPIAIGSYVRIKHQMAIGQIVGIDLHKVLIAVGKLHVYLPMQAVEVVHPPPAIPAKTRQPHQLRDCRPLTYPEPTLDLHGYNKAQALLALEKFLDRSLLLGHSRLKIIHGQGKGVLRSAIRDYLKAHPLVRGLTLQSPVHCMAGMTIVEI